MSLTRQGSLCFIKHPQGAAVQTDRGSGVGQTSDETPFLHMTLRMLLSLSELPLLHVKLSKN